MFEWDISCYGYSPGRSERMPDGSLGYFADAEGLAQL
jgi:hypothetical protein